MHAGASRTWQPIAPPGLERRGGLVERPTSKGLTSGRWQGWYDAQARAEETVLDRSAATFDGDAAAVAAKLYDGDAAYTSAELAALERLRLDGAGLYSWFVDGQGAEDLSRGLGLRSASWACLCGADRRNQVAVQPNEQQHSAETAA